MDEKPSCPRPPLRHRAYNWLLRHRLELSLAWGIILAVVALLAIIWPTPRTIASVAGCALLVALDIRLELRKVSRELHELRERRPVGLTMKFGDGDIVADLNGAMHQAIADLEQRDDGGDDAR